MSCLVKSIKYKHLLFYTIEGWYKDVWSLRDFLGFTASFMESRMLFLLGKLEKFSGGVLLSLTLFFQDRLNFKNMPEKYSKY